MKRTGLALLLLGVLAALPGCDASDPGQPAPGSISAPTRSNLAPKAAPDRGEPASPAR